MAGHTIVNLKEVEDMAPQFGFAPDLEARFATGALGLEKSGTQLPAAGAQLPHAVRAQAQGAGGGVRDRRGRRPREARR